MRHHDDPDHPERVTSVTVTRDPEFTRRDRDEILAEQELRRNTCTRCGQHDGLVELPDESDHVLNVTWSQYDGRVVQVTSLRCLFCGALDAVERAWHQKHKDDEKTAGAAGKGKGLGAALPKDGRTWVAHEPR